MPQFSRQSFSRFPPQHAFAIAMAPPLPREHAVADKLEQSEKTIVSTPPSIKAATAPPPVCPTSPEYSPLQRTTTGLPVPVAVANTSDIEMQIMLSRTENDVAAFWKRWNVHVRIPQGRFENLCYRGSLRPFSRRRAGSSFVQTGLAGRSTWQPTPLGRWGVFGDAGLWPVKSGILIECVS